MARRAEEKKRLREEREAREREERQASARKKRLMKIGVAAAVVIVAVIAVVALSGGGSSKSKSAVTSTNAQGLQDSPGPWPPEDSKLQARVKAMALPDPSDLVYHIHSNLEVYVDGKKQTVPAQIGIDQSTQFLASLHTHDTSGTIHQEAVQPYPFKLGQFFEVWGVVFTPTQLRAYPAGHGLVLQVWLTG